jgi:AP-1-like transcription factor
MINKRRRSQNRASQAAYRARQQQRMKDLEDKLTQLEQKHQDLSQSYESLQLEHSIAKQELETLQRSTSNHESTLLATTAYHWVEGCQIETSDPYVVGSGEFYNCRD